MSSATADMIIRTLGVVLLVAGSVVGSIAVLYLLARTVIEDRRRDRWQRKGRWE